MSLKLDTKQKHLIVMVCLLLLILLLWTIFVDCDSLMRKAYGATLIPSGSCSHSDWHRRWKSVIYHSGNHYVLPGGPTGRRYVDLLTEDVQHLAVVNFPSERVLVFSSVMLQRDQMVRKDADIRRLLDR